MRGRTNSLFSHPSYRYAELQNDNIQSAFNEHHLPALNQLKITSDLNGAILRITMSIDETFPELSKFIDEMPVNFSDPVNSGINIQNLKDYYQSLEALFKNYSTNHARAK